MPSIRLIAFILTASSVFYVTHSFSDTTVSVSTIPGHQTVNEGATFIENQIERSLHAPSPANSPSMGCFDVFYLDWTANAEQLLSKVNEGLCACFGEQHGAVPVLSHDYTNNVETLWGSLEFVEIAAGGDVSYMMDSEHYYQERGPCLGVFSEDDDWGPEDEMSKETRAEYDAFQDRLKECNKELLEWENTPPAEQSGRDILAEGCNARWIPSGEGHEKLESLFAHIRDRCSEVNESLVPDAGNARYWLESENLLSVEERLSHDESDNDFDNRGRECGSEDEDDDPCDPNPCGADRECELGDEGPGDYRCE